MKRLRQKDDDLVQGTDDVSPLLLYLQGTLSLEQVSIDKLRLGTNWKTIFIHPSGNASLKFIDLLSEADAQFLFDEANQLPFEEYPPIVMFGKPARMRRSIVFLAVPGVKGYSYANQTSKAHPLTPTLQRFMALINAICGASFNGILVNKYNGMHDYISPHSDDEAGLSPDVGVVAVSLGAERTMNFVEKRAPHTKHNVVMTDGSALCMFGSQFQKKYTHGIRAGKDSMQVPASTFFQSAPVKKQAMVRATVRISLTFRCHRVATL